MSENIAIKLQGVSKSFSGLDIISSVDMKVREQEFISILGPSGCGKTTILKLIAGLEDVDEGSIYINNNLVSNKKFTLAPDKRTIGMVFQDYALFPHLSVEENIAFGLRGGVKKNQEEVYKIIAMLELSGKEKITRHLKDSNALLVRTQTIKAEWLEKATGLEIISRHGVGLDNLPLETIKNKGIYLKTVGDVNSIAVACLAVLKKLFNILKLLKIITGIFAILGKV